MVCSVHAVGVRRVVCFVRLLLEQACVGPVWPFLTSLGLPLKLYEFLRGCKCEFLVVVVRSSCSCRSTMVRGVTERRPWWAVMGHIPLRFSIDYCLPGVCFTGTGALWCCVLDQFGVSCLRYLAITLGLFCNRMASRFTILTGFSSYVTAVMYLIAFQ
jgi:hypothetical protein